MKIKVRYIVWGVVLAVSAVLTLMEQKANQAKPLKQEIEGYVSSEFKAENENIEDNINHSELGKKYTFKVSDQQTDASCFTITTDFEELVSSDDYQTMGQTPLIVVLKKEKSTIEKYVENGLLNCSGELEMDEEDKIEINFRKVMEAVINGKTCEFGEKEEPIKIFYPNLNTAEGKLFRHFLLITANHGVYPSEESERAECEKQVKSFLEQSNVQGVDVMNRLTGVDDLKSDLYITFENNVLQVEGDEYEENFYISYPTETVEKQVYFQSTAEAGKEIQKMLTKDSVFFGVYKNVRYSVCNASRYRFEDRINISKYRQNNIAGICDEVNFKDAYNVIDIPMEILQESK